MRFREALKAGVYELLLARDSYRDMCMKIDLVSGRRTRQERERSSTAPFFALR